MKTRIRKFCASLVLCFLSLTPVAAQSQTDRDRDGLVGPVKSVEAYLIDFVQKEEKRRPSFTTTYNTEGNISKRATYDSTGAISARYVHTYDANGRSTGYEEYAAMLDKTLTIPRRHVYKLNEEGRKVEYIVFESNGTVGTRFVYKYDPKGNLIEQQWYPHTGQLGGSLIYTFDEKGKQTSETSYEGSGALSWKSISKYDNNGNKTEWVHYERKSLRYKIHFTYDDKGRVVEQETMDFNISPGALPPTHSPQAGKVTYTYDDDKRTREVATYAVDGTLKEKTVYAYDERKNEIGVTTFNADGSLKNGEMLLIDIEYDSHGNWTRKTRLVQYEKGGQIQAAYAELRVITYY